MVDLTDLNLQSKFSSIRKSSEEDKRTKNEKKEVHANYVPYKKGDLSYYHGDNSIDHWLNEINVRHGNNYEDF